MRVRAFPLIELLVVVAIITALRADAVTLVGSDSTANYVSDHQFNGATREASAVYVHGGASLTPVGEMEVRYSWWRPPYVW